MGVMMAVSYFKSSKLILYGVRRTELPGTFGRTSLCPVAWSPSPSLRPGCSCQCTSEETFGSNLTATKEQKMTNPAGRQAGTRREDSVSAKLWKPLLPCDTPRTLLVPSAG